MRRYACTSLILPVSSFACRWPKPLLAAPYPRSIRSSGFTLIELLVAMFLLAILGTAGFQMLFQINATRERVEAQSARLSELQRTFYWLAEDVTQIADRPVRSALDSQLAPLLVNIQGDSLFEFTRAGWTNPAADVSPVRSNLQRVAYALEGDKFIRQYWYHLEPLEETPTRRRQLLSGVDSLALRFLDGGGEWQESWPPLDPDAPSLPVAIEFSFELQDIGNVVRLFALPG